MTVPQVTELSLSEAQGIAKEAYIYAFPMLDSYRIQYAYFVDKNSPEYKAPFNQIKSIPRVYTPEDKAVQTPNSDTPYSMLGMDLRAEPLVLTAPSIEKERYFSIQLIDLYTHNFAYIGSRTTGNGGGKFLVAGPGWKGEKPSGIDKVIQSETELVLAVYRTQLINPDDLENVKEIQSGYKVQTLSEFLGEKAPDSASTTQPIDWVKPLSLEDEQRSADVFDTLNFLLGFCPTDKSEKELMERFAKIGIGPGRKLADSNNSPEFRKALEAGISEAWEALQELKKKQIDTHKIASGDLFGTREFLKNNYLYRMAAAKLGIFGNSKEEAMYPIYTVDAGGEPLDGAANSYKLRFEPGSLPPVNAFWSLTMYELPSSLLVENPINRYLINSPMLPTLQYDVDGGLTFFIQNESPGHNNACNWLPSPKAPFMAVMRLYWPKDSATSGEWKVPQIAKANGY